MILLVTDENYYSIKCLLKRFNISHIMEMFNVENKEKNYIPFPIFNIFKDNITNGDMSFKFIKSKGFECNQFLTKILKINIVEDLQNFKNEYYDILKNNSKLYYMSVIINYQYDNNNEYEENTLSEDLMFELFLCNSPVYLMKITQFPEMIDYLGEDIVHLSKIKNLLKFLVMPEISNPIYYSNVKTIEIVSKNSNLKNDILNFIAKATGKKNKYNL